MTLTIGVLAIVLALQFKTVLNGILHAYAFMVAGLSIPTLGAFFWKRSSTASALAGMIAGGITALVLILSGIALPFGIAPSFYGILISALVFIPVSILIPDQNTADDRLEKIGNSQIQHGPANDRIYLMKADPDDLDILPEKLNTLATEKNYSKIFAKVPASCKETFLADGYQQEGIIPQFYKGETDAAFLGKFIDPARAETPQQNEIGKIIKLAESRSGQPLRPLPNGYQLRQAEEKDASEMAEIYRRVFASYPFPIHDPEYLKETMRSHVCYFVAETDGKIAAAASGEMDQSGRNAEMTDFATLPEHLGNGLALHLLRFMEPEMRKRNIATLYTIARAVSPGMNITFAKCGYSYGGTLVNNTQISGTIESMNL